MKLPRAKSAPLGFQLSHYEDIKHKKVLIVDCHSAVRAYLRSQLALLGVSAVQGAVSSVDVLRLVRANTYDIILCDYVLDDGRDGQQLLEELRTRHLIPLSTIFIIVTGESAYQRVMSVAELGPDEYLVKPFTSDQLHGRLLRALYKRHVFADVHRHLEGGQAEAALAACARVIEQHREYALEALRTKGEILNGQHRHEEAESIYRQVLEHKAIPWAKMGLAVAVFGQGRAQEAQGIAQALTEDFPEYLAAYDFLATVHEHQGALPQAQAVLLKATQISPANTGRQRQVGDVALRNADLDAAERAFSTVLSRAAGSSMAAPSDYANLARVKLEQGDPDRAAGLARELRRDFRGDREAALAACVVESMAESKRGDEDAAAGLLEQALALRQSLPEETSLSPRIALELAHACLSHGREEEGQALIRQVAAEHHEDASMAQHVRRVFSAVGREQEATTLLDQVNTHVVETNNEGVLRARRGDFEGSVALLTQAADAVANLQFLANAAKAIFALLAQRGWDEALAERGAGYLARAADKARGDPRVTSAIDLMRQVARKYGVTAEALSAGSTLRRMM